MKLAHASTAFPSFETDSARVPPPPRGPERTLEELRRENARLRRTVAELETYRALAYRDALTGLWNRRYFEERLGQEISIARRQPGGKFTLLVLDLNGLKRINDDEGHAAGDAAIQRAAAFLRSRLREHDVCCRTGGDEFIVILRDLGPSEGVQVCARLRSELLLNNNTSREAPISLSMGIASFPDDSTVGSDLVLRADEAMYADKRRQKAAPEAALRG
jgi:diguanylate cyclase (GGDEF)-like protein